MVDFRRNFDEMFQKSFDNKLANRNAATAIEQQKANTDMFAAGSDALYKQRWGDANAFRADTERGQLAAEAGRPLGLQLGSSFGVGPSSTLNPSQRPLGLRDMSRANSLLDDEKYTSTFKGPGDSGYTGFQGGGRVPLMRLRKKAKGAPGYKHSARVTQPGPIGDVEKDDGTDTVDAKVREGEYLLNPETVASFGSGNYSDGVRNLDAIVRRATGKEPGPTNGNGFADSGNILSAAEYESYLAGQKARQETIDALKQGGHPTPGESARAPRMSAEGAAANEAAAARQAEQAAREAAQTSAQRAAAGGAPPGGAPGAAAAGEQAAASGAQRAGWFNRARSFMSPPGSYTLGTGGLRGAANLAGKTVSGLVRGSPAGAGIGGALYGLGTDTEDYATRFGVEMPRSTAGQVGLRAAGVLSDVGSAALNTVALPYNLVRHGLDFDDYADYRKFAFQDVQEKGGHSNSELEELMMSDDVATAKAAQAEWHARHPEAADASGAPDAAAPGAAGAEEPQLAGPPQAQDATLSGDGLRRPSWVGAAGETPDQERVLAEHFATRDPRGINANPGNWAEVPGGYTAQTGRYDAGRYGDQDVTGEIAPDGSTSFTGVSNPAGRAAVEKENRPPSLRDHLQNMLTSTNPTDRNAALDYMANVQTAAANAMNRGGDKGKNQRLEFAKGMFKTEDGKEDTETFNAFAQSIVDRNRQLAAAHLNDQVVNIEDMSETEMLEAAEAFKGGRNFNDPFDAAYNDPDDPQTDYSNTPVYDTGRTLGIRNFFDPEIGGFHALNPFNWDERIMERTVGGEQQRLSTDQIPAAWNLRDRYGMNANIAEQTAIDERIEMLKRRGQQ